MKRIIWLYFIFTLSGCQSTVNWDDPANVIEPGNYAGIFIFTEYGNVSQGNVRFTFTSDSYTCAPETPYLPPTSGGNFKIKNEQVTLTDLVPHTAEFDGSLILNGEFLFRKSNETIMLFQKDNKRDRLRYIELNKQK